MNRPRWRLFVGSGALVLLLAACGLGGERYPSGVDPAMTSVGKRAPLVEVEDELPATLVGRYLADLHWDAMPQHASGVFVGFGQISDEALQISAVTSDGTILWTTERPLSCTGFTLTTDEHDRALAVLTDLSVGTTTVSVTTASAYDLFTGDLVWGPVEVPGPHAGPGLVFSTLPTGGAMGATGPRVALDPTTGAVAVSEDDLDGVRIVGEYDGTVLLASDRDLIAIDARQEREQWRVPLGDLGLEYGSQVVAAPEVTPDSGFAFVGERDAGYALVDLAEGRVAAHTAQDTAADLERHVHMTVERDRLRGYDREGSLLWEQPVDPDARLTSAANGVIYLDIDNRIHTRSVVTGEPADVYGDSDPVALPRYGNGDGAVVLATSDGLFLATADTDDVTAPTVSAW